MTPPHNLQEYPKLCLFTQDHCPHQNEQDNPHMQGWIFHGIPEDCLLEKFPSFDGSGKSFPFCQPHMMSWNGKHVPTRKHFLTGKQLPTGRLFPSEKLFPNEKLFPTGKHFPTGKCLPNGKHFPNEKRFPTGKHFPTLIQFLTGKHIPSWKHFPSS